MADTPVKLSAQPSLYKRGARFYAKVKHLDGKWKNYNTGETIRQRALIVAEEYQARVDRGLPAIDKPATGGEAATPAALLTVCELAERFLREHHKPRIKDMDAYRRKMRYDLKYLVYPWLADLRASTLRRVDVKAYLGKLRAERDYSGHTLCLALQRLSAIFTWAIDEEVLDMAHPCRGISLAQPHPSEDHYSAEEIGRLLALPDCPVMVATAIYAGMRRGELRALRWGWVDLDAMSIEVRGSFQGLPKNGKPRTVPIHRELFPWLKRWQEQCPATPEALVFPAARRPAGRPMGGHNVRTWRMARREDLAELPELLKKAEVHVPDRPWHAFRHSLATHLAKATRGNLDAVSKILGHSMPGVAVTRGYVHTADLDYLAGELNKLSYAPRAPANVVDLQEERDKRRGRAPTKDPAAATDLLPEALLNRGKP